MSEGQVTDIRASSSKPGFNLSAWALKRAPLTRYLMIVLMLLGVAAYFQLGQDEDPPFAFRGMVVRAYWPGATAQQMADQVADKIEKTLQEVPTVDKLETYTKPGEMTLVFIASERARGAAIKDTWYEVRKRVNDIKVTLPQGVYGPFFNDDFGDVYGVMYALQWDSGYSLAEVKYMADGIRQELLRVPDVNKVSIEGYQSEKIYINIANAKLAQMGLDMGQVVAQLGQQNAVAPAGEIHTDTDTVRIRVGGQFGTVQELENMPIRGATGAMLRLGDLGTIVRGYTEPAEVLVSHQGKRAVVLGVSMKKGGDIVRLGKNLQKEMRLMAQALPAGVTLTQIQDQPKAVTRSVNEFVRALIEAIFIVLGVSFISLGLHKGGRLGYYIDMRPGLVVGITIPLVLAMTFIAMWYTDIGLHKISLGSLIIALGLLVDDAIIAVEMMVRKLEEGYDKMYAATYAYNHTAMPMLTGTLITAVGFLPIGMAKSITGEYTYAIFAVTVMSLIISWLASVYFVPYLGALLLKVKPHAGEAVNLFDTPFYRAFTRLVDACVQYRWATIGITLAVFVLGIVGMAKVEQQFFPDSERPEIMLEYWLPEGASMQANEAVGKEMEKLIMQTEGVQSVSLWMGSGVPHFYLPLEQLMPQTNLGQMFIIPKDLKARAKIRAALPRMMADKFPQVSVRVRYLPAGPPVAYPVQFRILGSDPQKLRQLADEVKLVLRANPNTRNVNDSWREQVKVLRLAVDQDKARALGVSSQSIAQATQLFTTGVSVGQLRDGNELIDIVLRQPAEMRSVLSDLNNAYIATASGRSIPLAQIARPVLDWEPGIMWRQNRDYAIMVNADIVDNIQPATVSMQIEPKLREMEKSWPVGYRIVTAGAIEMSSKGTDSILAGVPIMLFITFTLLMLQLQSFSKSMLAFLTGFMGIPGVAAALLLFGKPFGFVASLGVIALMGMIQRNSVILIDQIEQHRQRGMDDWNAIVNAAVQRMRPIALTAAAAIFAMLPLTRSVFWGPMAIAIMGGLVIATALTLLALPAMYAAWFKVKRKH